MVCLSNDLAIVDVDYIQNRILLDFLMVLNVFTLSFSFCNQGDSGIHGRSGLPGRKGEQVRIIPWSTSLEGSEQCTIQTNIWNLVLQLYQLSVDMLPGVVVSVFQGELGSPGATGTAGKEGLIGPKVLVYVWFVCVRVCVLHYVWYISFKMYQGYCVSVCNYMPVCFVGWPRLGWSLGAQRNSGREGWKGESLTTTESTHKVHH